MQHLKPHAQLVQPTLIRLPGAQPRPHALATRARRGRTEARARNVLLANTRQSQELSRVLIADRGDTRQQLALHQMPHAQLVQRTRIRPPGARPWLHAFAKLARRGRTEDRARNVWREPTKHRQEPTLAVIAFPASIQRLSVRQQIRRAWGVRLIQTRRQGARPCQLAPVTQDRRGKMEERAHDAFLESTREQLATQHAQTVLRANTPLPLVRWHRVHAHPALLASIQALLEPLQFRHV